MKRVLSIDGGGIRGIIPAIVLREFERESHQQCCQLFDMVVGTSTGGLIALGIADPNYHNADTLVDLFKDKGTDIFRKSRIQLPYTVPKYSSKGLKSVLQKHFKANRLRDATLAVLVTSYDTAERRPRFLTSWDAITDPKRDLAMWEAGIATAAAPTYFPAFSTDELNLIDGGVAANNPAAIGFAEAKRRWPNEEILLISIGTGRVRKRYLAGEVNNWGIRNWVVPLIDFLFAGASESTHNVLKNILSTDQYFRFQCEIPDDQAAMDDASEKNIKKLRAIASEFVNNFNSDIKRAVTYLSSSQSSKRVLTSRNAMINIALPEMVREEKIRLSISALVRICINGKYLLVRGHRIKNQFQPVGGVLKFFPSSSQLFSELDVCDDNCIPRDKTMKDDLRVRLPASNLERFLAWYQAGEDREDSPWREFYEELIKPGFFTHADFPYINVKWLRRFVSDVHYTEHFGCYEVLISEIYEFLPNNTQETLLMELLNKSNENYKWVSEAEIRSRGVKRGEQMIADIATNAIWILPEE